MDVRILGPLEVGNGDGPPVRTLGGAKQRAVLALLVLHRGEVVSIDRFHGIAVQIGARISALAGPGEVLASSTVADLVAGSGLRFTDRGTHALKGVPGEWRIVALAQDGDSERPVLDQDESLMRASDRLTLRLARHMPRSMRAATRLVRRG